MTKKSRLGLALILLGAGLASGLAMPPIGAWPILFFSFPVLMHHLIRTEGFGQGFWRGWVFGFGYFLACLHWIGFAFLVDAATYLWMMPFAICGLAAFLALYWGLASALCVWLRPRGFSLLLSFPALLAGVEWLRGHLLSGFPWAPPGLAADGMGGVVQVAALIGMPGLTLLVVLWACAPIAFTGTRSGFETAAAGALLALLPLVWIAGDFRVNAHATSFVAGVTLRLVQPNVPQNDKWRAGNASAIFDHLVEMSRQPGQGHTPSHILWPESAVPFLLDESANAKAALARALDKDQILITGAIRRARPDPDADYFTSVMVIDSDGAVRGTYDKWRLVPGGEYLPLASLLQPLGFQKLVTLPGGFTAGGGPRTVVVPGADKAGMGVCYEAIFPDRQIDANDRPSWLINVTNDGWFGESTGPYQHLAQARLRAIEQGLPMARVANTGISAVIDPVGRYVTRTKLGVQSIVDSGLPKALWQTVYGRHGDAALLFLLAFTVLAARLFARKLR